MSEAVDEVRYDARGAVAVVTIDRQRRRNAIDGPTAEALVAALERFEADDDASVMVITGAGGSFCAGADLTALESLAPRAEGPDGPLVFTRRVAAKPTIAAVDGWAVAGGLELALWCDLRIASPTARFGCLERRWGVPLIDGGTQRLPRVVGLGRALDLIITGREAGADDALAMGLVNEVVADPLARALELAEAIAVHPQETMLSDREAAHAALGLPPADGLALEARLGRERVTDALEGARRFRVRP
jgi:enoyl-CoA hydratase